MSGIEWTESVHLAQEFVNARKAVEAKADHVNQMATLLFTERENINRERREFREKEQEWIGRMAATRVEIAEVYESNSRQVIKLLAQVRQLKEALRRANGTRGSGRSPQTGPNAPRPTRASGKTSPSRGGKGKPSRCGASGASPKTPRKATARPQRTAKKSRATG